MLLKNIEISGFKSFAKKSVLEFRTPITAIVGPNGSGKSNVAEAFSFVLGEQSIKSLRGKKGEDLIFNGSKTGSRSSRANVKVVFDNRKKFLDVPYEEVIIERVVHRDGANQYLINGSQVRLKDIIEILAGANIGSSGHHIISQGEADKILNVNSKERKALIEDALGLKIYQIKRRESERKLQKTEENIEQVGTLRKEIRPHLKFLRKQVDKIEKTLEMRKDLFLLYKEYLKRESDYIEVNKEYIQKEREEPRRRLALLDKELREAKGIIDKSEGKGEKKKELDELEKEGKELRKERDELSFGLGRLQGELSSREKILEKEEKREREKTIKVSEAQKVVEEVEARVISAEESSDLKAIRKILSEIRNLARGLILKTGHSSGADLKSERKAVGDLRVEIARETKTIKDLAEKEEKILEKLEELRKKIGQETESQIGAEKQTFKILSEQSEIKSKLSQLKNLEERIEKEERNFKGEITEAATMVGRDVLDYKEFSIKDGSGSYLTREEIAKDNRESQEKRLREIERIKIRLEDAGGASGEEIMKEYEEVNERDQFLEKEIEDLEKTAKSLKGLIKELEDKLEVEFKKGIEKINNQFQEFFSLMFGGGDASLKVVKLQKPQRIEAEEGGEIPEIENIEESGASGVEINVNLPRKKIKGLMVLSGGERALTSIALLFAMSQVKPPPFIILDETDAALDEANSRKYGDMIESLSKHSQLILVTHNRETMSRAGVLYGVTMGADSVSKLLSVDLEEAVEVAK